MKKEKRELTLEQLVRKHRNLRKISNILAFMFCIYGILVMFLNLNSDGNENKGIVILVQISVVIILTAMLFINLNSSDRIKNQIILKEKQMKLKVLKQLAKEHGGHIKAFVSLKDEEVITDILSKSIEKVVIDFTQDKNFVTTIQYADDTARSGICIPAKEFMSILDENIKKIMLNDSIKNIILGDSVGDIKEIIITGKTYIYKEDISDDELLEMFELKE